MPRAAATLVLALAACAPGARLADYPSRVIDRPYTLPKGVAAWSSPTVGGVGFSHGEVNGVVPVPYPLLWQIALSDDWNIIFAPVPLAAMWQITNGDYLRMGTLIVAGLGYSPQRGFELEPSIELSLRLKAGRDVALDLTIDGNLQIAAEVPNLDAGSAGATLGPLVQLRDDLHLRPRLSLRYEGGARYTDLFAGEIGDIPRRENVTVGLGLEGGLVLSRQWDLTFGVEVRRTEPTADRAETKLIGAVNVIYYW